MTKPTIWDIRRSAPSKWQPTLPELTNLCNALSEAARNAERDGRPATAKGYRAVRDNISTIIDADPIEQAWREEAF